MSDLSSLALPDSPAAGSPLYDYYAKGGTTCVLCGKQPSRPVNRNAHAEMHVRRGEAHEASSGMAYHTEYRVGPNPGRRLSGSSRGEE